MRKMPVLLCEPSQPLGDADSGQSHSEEHLRDTDEAGGFMEQCFPGVSTVPPYIIFFHFRSTSEMLYSNMPEIIHMS